MENSSGAAGPGWYEAPNEPNRKRYWDGEKWGAYSDERSDQDEPDKPIEPNVAALGLGTLAGLLAVVAVFLPQLESSTFARIESNSMIQNGDGWLVLLFAVGVFAGVYRAYAGKIRTWAVAVFGLLILGVAIYDGTGSRTELHSAVEVFGKTVNDKGSAGVGIYAAGAAGVLAMLAGLNLARGGTMLDAKQATEETKVCPDCAETVLAAARICKHCGHEFEPAPPPPI